MSLEPNPDHNSLIPANWKNLKEIVEEARWDSNMKKLTARANFLAENRKKNQWTYGLETYGTSFWLDKLDKGKKDCFNSQVSGHCPSNFNEIYTYWNKKFKLLIFLTVYSEDSFAWQIWSVFPQTLFISNVGAVLSRTWQIKEQLGISPGVTACKLAASLMPCFKVFW